MARPLHRTGAAKRTALEISVTWAQESAHRWATVANALQREGYPKRATEARLMQEASGLMAQALRVELGAVERSLARGQARLDGNTRRKAQKAKVIA